MKRCSRCKNLKDVSEFGRHSCMKDGLRSYCKSCASEDNKFYRYHPNEKASDLRHPDKHKARYTLSNAVAGGYVIPQPCEICGDQKAEAHHEDYTTPLDVKWLCKKHHMQLHAGRLTARGQNYPCGITDDEADSAG